MIPQIFLIWFFFFFFCTCELNKKITKIYLDTVLVIKENGGLKIHRPDSRKIVTISSSYYPQDLITNHKWI